MTYTKTTAQQRELAAKRNAALRLAMGITAGVVNDTTPARDTRKTQGVTCQEGYVNHVA